MEHHTEALQAFQELTRLLDAAKWNKCHEIGILKGRYDNLRNRYAHLLSEASGSLSGAFEAETGTRSPDFDQDALEAKYEPLGEDEES